MWLPGVIVAPGCHFDYLKCLSPFFSLPNSGQNFYFCCTCVYLMLVQVSVPDAQLAKISVIFQQLWANKELQGFTHNVNDFRMPFVDPKKYLPPRIIDFYYLNWYFFSHLEFNQVSSQTEISKYPTSQFQQSIRISNCDVFH